jgi:hypothetical protein
MAIFAVFIDHLWYYYKSYHHYFQPYSCSGSESRFPPAWAIAGILEASSVILICLVRGETLEANPLKAGSTEIKKGSKGNTGIPLSPLSGDAFQVRSKSAGEQAMWRHELKSLQRGITTLLEASQCHLLITPPSHFTPRKVEG